MRDAAHGRNCYHYCRGQQAREHLRHEDVGRVFWPNSLKLASQSGSLLFCNVQSTIILSFIKGERISSNARVKCGLNVKSTCGAHAGRPVTSIYGKRDSSNVARTVRYQERDRMSDFIRCS